MANYRHSFYSSAEGGPARFDFVPYGHIQFFALPLIIGILIGFDFDQSASYSILERFKKCAKFNGKNHAKCDRRKANGKVNISKPYTPLMEY